MLNLTGKTGDKKIPPGVAGGSSHTPKKAHLTGHA